MTKIRLEIELSYDGDIMYDDDEGRDWFFNEILGDKGQLLLHSNELGDTVGEVRVIRRINEE